MSSVTGSLRQLGDAAAALVGQNEISCSGATCTFMGGSIYNSARVDVPGVGVVERPLCPEVAFKGQRGYSFASAFLIGPDLVATAGHSICGAAAGCGADDSCSRTKIVFDYYLTAGQTPATIPASKVFSCSRVLRGVSKTGGPGVSPFGEDWAIVKLDRPVTDRTPFVPKRTGAIPQPFNQNELVSFGASLGLPLKMARNVLVTVDNPGVPRYFYSNADVFEGNSGGVLAEVSTGMAVGITTAGGASEHVWRESGDCAVPTTCVSGEDCPYFPAHTRMTWVAEQLAARTQLAVDSWQSNRIDAYAIGADQTLQHKAWDGAAWLPSFDGWESLGGTVDNAGRPLFNDAPVVFSWGPNRQDIFITGADGVLYHKAWNGSAWLPSFQGWEAVGGGVIGRPAVASWGVGRLDVFVLGTGGDILHRYLANGSESWVPSSSWESLGGLSIVPPTAVARTTDRIDVFTLGTDGGAYDLSFEGTWGWTAFGGTFTGAPTATARSSDRMELFGHRPDGMLQMKSWTATGGWSNWVDFGGPAIGAPTVVSWGGSRLDLVVQWSDRSYRHRARTDAAGWGGWNTIPGTFLSAPAVSTWPNRLDVYGQGTDGTAWHWYGDGNTWTGEPQGGALY